LTAKPKILVVRDPAGRDAPLPIVTDGFEVEEVRSPLRALARMSREPFDGIFVSAGHIGEAIRMGKLLQNERILDGMPDGIALLGADNIIIWGNGRIAEWTGKQSVVGENFYAALNSPEILGPDFCPFHTALITGKASSSVLRSGDNRYFHVHAVPVSEGSKAAEHLIVTVHDVTKEILQQQKLAAIHQAGQELSDLTAEELSHMTIDERIKLLKSNILHYTKDLLHFDVVEIRLLDQKTNRLEPLLAVGMEPEAENRLLFAQPQNNGVTGYVAANGKSYLCDDTTEDPLYLQGCKGGRSSLTVPLILHDEVIGTFNVESPDPQAFTESDLQFLEIFGRDVAAALNTLELLAVQKVNAAQESVEAIHGAVALPVDEILNDAVNVMQRYIGHDTDVVERLQRILRHARDIKQVIQKVGQSMAPVQALPAGKQVDKRPVLKGRRILVVDADEAVRSAAHNLLERYGCVVETAHDGNEAACMVRNVLHDDAYDVIIADIRLPDMNGYELLVRLQEFLDPVPLVLMTGYGYDPGHSIVKAKQAGIDLVLYKPFRLDQLLETIEKAVAKNDLLQPGGNK
jgi:CheY-like chemotaxis protein/PAS domain-containing protein